MLMSAMRLEKLRQLDLNLLVTFGAIAEPLLAQRTPPTIMAPLLPNKMPGCPE
jgi:hypothetical protein